MDIPVTGFVAIGAVLAALIAGFFSVLGLVASKENKVSEFRLAWIDGLRVEIASYTSAVQELARIERARKTLAKKSSDAIEGREDTIGWLELSASPFEKTVESLACIHLRLNPKHVKDPGRPEYKLMQKVIEARDLFNEEKYAEAAACCIDIRDAAAPLLKSTWDLVKKGELAYRIIRWSSIMAVAVALIAFVYLVSSLWSMYFPSV